MIVLSFGIIIVIGISLLIYSTSSNPVSSRLQGNSPISLSGSPELCAYGCLYPSPFFEATLFINSTNPVAEIQLFINGTSEGSMQAGNLTQYYQVIKMSPNNSTLPIIIGHNYGINLTAIFDNGSHASVSVVVAAIGTRTS